MGTAVRHDKVTYSCQGVQNVVLLFYTPSQCQNKLYNTKMYEFYNLPHFEIFHNWPNRFLNISTDPKTPAEIFQNIT